MPKACVGFVAFVLLIVAPLDAATDLVIGSGPTTGVTFADGVFFADGPSAVLNATSLVSALAAGDVTVRVGLTAPGLGDITTVAPIVWASPNRLRLEAYRNIRLDATIESTGGAAIQLRADATGTGIGMIIRSGGHDAVSSGPIHFFYNPPAPTAFGSTTRTFMLVNDPFALQRISMNPAGSYALGRNIDAAPVAGFVPIGSSASPFTGVLFGDGREITNLSIQLPGQDNVGLFGVARGASITDLSIRSANVVGASNTGILLGLGEDAITIARCDTSGSVATTTGSAVGGLIGQIRGGSVAESYSMATVTSTGNTEPQGAGGLIGIANAFVPRSMTIANSFAGGEVLGGGTAFVAGLIGFNNNTSAVSSCFSFGRVSSFGIALGGLIGYNNAAPVINSFWDTQASGLSVSSAGIGLTTSSMQSMATFTGAGWDFSNVWRIFNGRTYPFLATTSAAVLDAPASATGGFPLTYSFRFAASTQTHDGLIPVRLTHALPAGVTFVSFTKPAGVICVPGAGALIDCSGSVDAGSQTAISFVVQVPVEATGSVTVSGTFAVGSAAGTVESTVALVSPSDLRLTKVHDPAFDVLGGPVRYVLTVSNSGPAQATDVVLEDFMPPGVAVDTIQYPPAWSCGKVAGPVRVIVTCTSAGLTVGDTATIEILGRLPDRQPFSLIENLAHVRSSSPERTTADNTAFDIVIAHAEADLGVTIADAPDPALPGTWVTYTVIVQNHGPSDAVAVLDAVELQVDFNWPTTTIDLPSFPGWSSCQVTPLRTAVLCQARALNAGAALSLAIRVLTPSSFVGNVPVSATVRSPSVLDSNPSNNAAVERTAITTFADLNVVTTAPVAALAGTSMTWTITAVNSGPSAAGTVTLTHPLPPDVTFLGITNPPEWTCVTPAVGATGAVSCSRGSMPAQATSAIAITGFLPATMTPRTLTVQTTMASATTDPDPLNNSSVTTTSVTASADLAVALSGRQAFAGEVITLAFALSSSGPSVAELVQFDVAFPQGISFRGISGTTAWGCSGTPAGDAVRCIRPVMFPGSEELHMFAEIDSDAPAGDRTIRAHITSNTPDPVLPNNVVMPVIGVSRLTNVEVHTTAPASVVAGTSFDATVLVRNDGPSSAHEMVLRIALPPSLLADSVTTPAGWVCTATDAIVCTTPTFRPGQILVTARLDVDPAAASPLTITSTVSSITPEPSPSNNVSTASISVMRVADLAVTSSGSTASKRGPIAWQVTVRNDGPSQAEGVTLSIDAPGGTSVSAPPGWACSANACSTTSMPIGEASFALTTTLGTGPAPEFVSLIAAVSSAADDPSPLDNSSTATVILGDTGNLSITNIAPATAIAGTSFAQKIAVTNSGPEKASKVVMEMVLPAGLRISSVDDPRGWRCTNAGTSISCSRAMFDLGTAMFALIIAVDPGARPGPAALTATVSSESDPVGTNNSATAVVVISASTPP